MDCIDVWLNDIWRPWAILRLTAIGEEIMHFLLVVEGENAVEEGNVWLSLRTEAHLHTLICKSTRATYRFEGETSARRLAADRDCRPGLHNKIPALKIFARDWVAQESIFLHYQR